MTTLDSSRPSPFTGKARNAFWVAAVVALVIGAFSLYLFRLSGAQSAREYVPFVALWTISAVAAISALLSRLGRVTLAMYLLIGVLMLGNLTVAIVTVGFGLLAGLLTFVATSAIAGNTLEARPASRALVVAAAVSIVIVLVDLFGPSGRLSGGDDVVGIAQAMVAVIAVVFGLFTLRQFATFTLRTKLIALFLAVALTPVALLSYLNYQSTRSTLINNTNQSLLAAASQTAQTVDAFLGTNLDTIRTEAQIPSVVDYLTLPASERRGSAEETSALETLRALSRQDTLNISSYAILDANGLDVLDTFPTDIGVQKANRDYFQGPMQSTLPYVSPVEISRTTFVSSLYFSAPVRNPNSRAIIGVLRVRYNGTVLQQLLNKNNGVLGQGSFATLLDEYQIRLAHSTDASLNLKSVAPLSSELVTQLQKAERLPDGTPAELSTNLPAFSQALAAADAQTFFSAPLNTGLPGDPTQQAAVVKLSNQPWYLVYGVPQSVALAPVQDQSRSNTLLALTVTVAVALVAVFGAQLLAAPINRLTAVAQSVRAGNLDTTAKVESQDEIGTLAETFNQMTAQLRDTLAGLEQRVADRTRALALSGEVSRRLSTILNQDQLINEVVEQLHQTFNFYHVQIYLFDGQREHLLMVGGTGEAGKTLLARGHQIPRGRGLVGKAADTNLPVLVPDVTSDPSWLPNALLPDTQSELAVPIAVGERVLGVLDVQQSTAGGLRNEDTDLIQAVANQVAIALQNTQSYAQAQQQAQREALINAITQKIRSTDNVELALQVAAREIGRALNLSQTRVKLGANGSNQGGTL